MKITKFQSQNLSIERLFASIILFVIDKQNRNEKKRMEYLEIRVRSTMTKMNNFFGDGQR